MTIREFKDYVAQIPEEFDAFNLSARQARFMTEEELDAAKAEGNTNEQLYAAMDMEIVACFVDEETKQLALLDGPSYNIIVSVMNNGQQPSAEVIEDEGLDQAPESAE